MLLADVMMSERALRSLNKPFSDTYKAFNEEALKLYKYVVHIEGQKVEITSIDDTVLPLSHAVTTPYKNLEEVPEELQNKIKRLMWCADSDIHDGLGVKVNDATYWVS
jgi:DNA repair ATPase RecN